MSSSRRSSQSESTWSGQWDDQVQDVSASTDVAIQVGSHALTEKARPYYCLKVTGLVLLILALIAGALIGGYLLRRYVVELKNKGQDSSLQFGNWKDSECQQLNRSTTTSQCSLGNNQKPTLLIICLSGFRPDFITKDATPALLRIKNCGVHAPSGLRPAFPTNSIPNQYTIATGLHPESHGIVDDTFRDHDTGKVFDGSRGQTGPLQNDPGWWKGEPIWQTAKNQGKRAFVYHWAGSEVVGRKPDESVGYQTNTPLKQQFEKVTGWVTASGADRPAIVMAFIDEPATTARRVGTKGQEFGQTLRNLDNEIDRLLQNLFTKSLLPCTNMMIVSDHGLEDSTCTNAMDLTSILARNMQADHLSIPVSSNSFEFFGAGGHARVSIVPQPNSANPVHPYMLHNSLYCNHSQNQAVGRFYTLYNTDNMPRRLHFSDAIRIEREIAIAKLGRSVWKTTSGAACDKVIHGSDNIYPDMHGVFLAVGPSFRSAVPVETFSNVELYSVMAELVGLNPGPNNGTLGALQDALVTQTGIAPELTMPAYQRETFPTSEEMKKRQGQSCSYLIEGGLDEADKRLNMSETLSAKLVLANSAPYGVPGLLEIRLNMTLLVNHGFLLGYSFKYRLPLWSVLPVRAGTLKVPVTDGDVRAPRPRNDVRLPLGSTLTCSDMESMPVSDSSPRVHPAYLVPTGLTGDLTDRTDANVVTNMVLMYQEFRRDVWAPLWERVAAALSAKGGLIFSGPVFDHAPQFGHADSPENITFSLGPAGTSVPLPSHYYLVALRNSDKLPASCIATKCHPDVLAFILPNSLETAQHPCQVSIDDYLQNHMATVKDVERISGLRLLVNLPPLEAVRLRTMLPNKLWW